MHPSGLLETTEKAAPVLMKYDMETKTWKANADEGNCSFDMKWAVEGIQYSKEDSVQFHNIQGYLWRKNRKSKAKDRGRIISRKSVDLETMRATNGWCYLPDRLPLRSSSCD